MNLGPSSMAGPEQLPKWDLPFQRSQHPKLCSWIGPFADEQIPFIDIHSGRRHWEVSWIFDCNICFLRSLYWRNLELLQVAGNPRESTGIRKLNHGILPEPGRLKRGHQWQKALQLFWELNRSHCRASEAGRCWISGGNGRYNRYGVRSYWVHLGVIFITIRVRHHWHHALQNMENHFGSRRLGIKEAFLPGLTDHEVCKWESHPAMHDVWQVMETHAKSQHRRDSSRQVENLSMK